MRGLWRSFVPFLLWWPDVDRGTLKADAFAALTGVVVVLPQGVAFATIAGMPPEYGLYAAMVPAIVAAVFGSSRQLVSGPTTAASIVLFSTLSALAVPGTEAYVRYALTLTFMVGAIQLAMGAGPARHPRQLRLAFRHRRIHLRGGGADRGESAQELPRP